MKCLKRFVFDGFFSPAFFCKALTNKLLIKVKEKAFAC